MRSILVLVFVENDIKHTSNYKGEIVFLTAD